MGAGATAATLAIPMRESRAFLAAVTAAVLLLLAAAPASAHALHGNVDAPLPFVAYLAGAAVAVALSFVFAALVLSLIHI